MAEAESRVGAREEAGIVRSSMDERAGHRGQFGFNPSYLKSHKPAIPHIPSYLLKVQVISGGYDASAP